MGRSYCRLCYVLLENSYVSKAQRGHQIDLHTQEVNIVYKLTIKTLRLRGGSSAKGEERRQLRKRMQRALERGYVNILDRFLKDSLFRNNLIAQGHTEQSVKRLDEDWQKPKEEKLKPYSQRVRNYSGKTVIRQTGAGATTAQTWHHPQYYALQAQLHSPASQEVSYYREQCPAGHTLQYLFRTCLLYTSDAADE